MRFHTAAAAGLAALALAAAGCGGDGGDSASPAPPNAQASGTQSGAATLRATLTALLTDHVYQAGVAIRTGVGAGLGSPAFEAATATLEENSVGLSKAIESVNGERAGRTFLGLWRSHVAMYVAYAKATLAGDRAGALRARRDLDGYRQDFGAFLHSANPHLSKEAVTRALLPHVRSVLATIDAAVAKSPAVFEQLSVAAGHMPAIAKMLAAGIAAQHRGRFGGSVDDAAAELRAHLTSLLEDHAYQAVIALGTGAGTGRGSRSSKAAATTLDDNSKALAGAIADVYGADVGKTFLALWRSHIGMLGAYAQAEAAKDADGAEAALARLDKYRTDFGAFLQSVNPAFSKDHLANLLGPHVETVAAAIRAVLADSSDAPDRLAEAAAHMPRLADTLARGIAKQHPERFPS